MKNSLIGCFRRYGISDLERAQTSKHFIIENQLLLKLCLSETTFVGYAKNGSSCLPVRPNKKGIISNHCRPVCSGQGGQEETVLSTIITVTRTLYVTDKNSFK